MTVLFLEMVPFVIYNAAHRRRYPDAKRTDNGVELQG